VPVVLTVLVFKLKLATFPKVKPLCPIDALIQLYSLDLTKKLKLYVVPSVNVIAWSHL